MTLRADELRIGDRCTGDRVEDCLTIPDLGLTWIHWFTWTGFHTAIYASGDLIDEVRR